MILHVTGLNHRSAPVEIREKIAFPEARLSDAVKGLLTHHGVAEGLILSTCNRVEIVVSTESPNPAEVVTSFLEATRQMPKSALAPHLYHFEDRDAIRHLFRVASSLDSMVVGEPQILGQLKEAYAVAKSAGAVNGLLDGVITRAFSVAKRVRTETEIGQSAVSVSYAAVELARDIFGKLDGLVVYLIGAGKMSELAARHLRRAGAKKILIANRTRQRAQEMAALFDGAVIPYEDYQSPLASVDIVITSSGAPHFILTKEMMRKVMHDRRNKPVFLIDIAVPRNIEPAVNTIDSVFLYDIDDLGQVVEKNRLSRMGEAEAAERIIDEEVDRMLARLREREVTPTIVSIQEQLEQWRQAELSRTRNKLGPLTPQQEEAIDTLTRSLMAKVAHGPIAEIRRTAGGNQAGLIETVRRIFRLPESH